MAATSPREQQRDLCDPTRTHLRIGFSTPLCDLPSNLDRLRVSDVRPQVAINGKVEAENASPVEVNSMEEAGKYPVAVDDSDKAGTPPVP